MGDEEDGRPRRLRGLLLSGAPSEERPLPNRESSLLHSQFLLLEMFFHSGVSRSAVRRSLWDIQKSA
jgi:hypothetical protein